MRLSSNFKLKGCILIKSSRILLPRTYSFNGVPSSANRFFTDNVAPRCREEVQSTIFHGVISVIRYARSHRLLSVAKIAHGSILRSGLEFDSYISNNLLAGYLSCGDIYHALQMLGNMLVRDSVSWNIMISGLVSLGLYGDGFVFFCNMIRVGSSPTQPSFASILVACAEMEDLFEQSTSHDIVTWNSLINGYAYNGEGDAGLRLFQRLLSSGIVLNESTFLSFLSCCSTIAVLKNARKAHVLILKLSQGFDEWTDNITLTMYCRTKSLEDAATFFKFAEVKGAISSNLIMGLYRSCGRYEESINLFRMVQSQGCHVDDMTFSGVISSCSRLGFLDFGCQMHACVIKSGFVKFFHLMNSIIELYSQCGRMDDMERVFEEFETVDLFAWNAMLIGYADMDLSEKAFSIWHDMLKFGIKLNEFSYSALLHACSHAHFLLIGGKIHTTIIKAGLTFDVTLMNSLLTLYSNCRQMEKSHLVFEEISSPDFVSYNAMISCLTQNGFPAESIQIYMTMHRFGIETNEMTYGSIFSSCSLIVDLKLGLQFHAQAVKRAFDLFLSVSNSLITMYARCGSIHESSKIFSGTRHPDLITWNSMINAYAHHGLGKEALFVFERMNNSNEKPNRATFTGVLSSCSRAGLVSEACRLFDIMDRVYGIVPGEEHCACFVDTLCRAGKLSEAKLFIENMDTDNSSLVWRTLLSFCRLNGNVELGEVSAKKIMALEPWDSAPYVILSDLYASLGNRVAKHHVRRMMEDRGVKKETGCSWFSG